jgi:hypothetical protein
MAIPLRLLFLIGCAGAILSAQTNSGPDEIVFINGEKLVGHFVRATATTVTFKSDALGDLTIDWKKVKELHTAQKVAVIRKGVKLKKKEATVSIPEGTLSVADQKIQLAPPPPQAPQPIPVGDANVVMDSTAFDKAMTHTPSLLQDWKGTATVGLSLVQATQESRTFTGAISMVRAEPSENWLDPQNRTAFDFSESYGEVTQPATPTVKTSIFHADAQRDEYFSTSLFGFGEADFDHNYSQGLDLQQTYAGGIGWSAVRTSLQELDLKASISYIRQQFATGPSMNLIGSVFAEHYNRKLPHGVTLDQHASITPAWNNTNAYSWLASALLTMPVYKRLSGSAGVIDTFLNNPPPMFKKNSLQFTLGMTYVIQ